MKRSDLRLKYKFATGEKPFNMGNWLQDELSFKYGAWLEEKLLELQEELENRNE